MKSKKLKQILISILFIIVVLWFLQKLVVPKYVDDVIEGALIAEYYDDVYNHDVVFIGDCEVYENFSPQLLYDEYGINSYIRGSAQQLIWQSYYLLEDTLKYETPKVVIFNVLSMKYDTPQHEAYNRMTLEGMRWSPSKVNSILASMTDDEHFIDYVFPLLRYHSRITEIGPSDFEYLFKRERVSHNGYYLRVDVKPAEDVPEGDILPDYTFGDNSYKYLDMMTKLCEENGIRLILIKAPSLYPCWYPEWETQIEEYAAAHNLDYINFLELIDETGIDYSLDTYDGGLHLNLSGAEKVTRYLGEYLVENVGLEDRRDEQPLATFWDEKRELYEADIASQYAALEETQIEQENIEDDDNDAPEVEELIESEHKGYYFVLGDIGFTVDELASPIINFLGEPLSYYEAPSCAFRGLDKIYTYGSYVVETYPDDILEDRISAIVLKDDTIATNEGAMIGNSKDEIIAIYGEPSTKEDTRFIYEYDGMRLNIVFRNDEVVLIEYRTTALDE